MKVYSLQINHEGGWNGTTLIGVYKSKKKAKKEGAPEACDYLLTDAKDLQWFKEDRSTFADLDTGDELEIREWEI